MTDDGYTIYDERNGLPVEDEPEEQQDAGEPAGALIEITQLPAIVENLHALRDRWEQEAADAGKLVCNEDSVQAVKTLRAGMRKEFDEADRQRKAVKEQYMAAWNTVEAAWKECVAEPFKRADAAYKEKIGAFEDELKARCKAELEEYFAELCAAHGVDFLTLDKALTLGGLKLSLADAKSRDGKRLKDALGLVVSNVACGMDNIAKLPDAAEVMAEYKQCLDVGHAAAVVAGRKLRVQAEKEAAERRAEEEARKAEAVKKVQAAAPAVEIKEPPRREPEKVFEEFTFTVYGCTRTQLVMIREFLRNEGIKYE